MREQGFQWQKWRELAKQLEKAQNVVYARESEIIINANGLIYVEFDNALIAAITTD